MIEFNDVTGLVTGNPGRHFYKMDSISDDAIEEYKSRGAEIVKMDKVSHAYALKLKTARNHFLAQEKLGSVRAAQELEDPGLTRLRDIRQAAVDETKAKDEVAEAKLVEVKAEKAARAKAKRDSKPKKGKKK
ncbi:hypothetical protein LCGC14_1884690 [marine sediment metagenome]|uniref:Uncharacterized protein n=1 Tax=marine sediment metagenome TaxID=412755 RepID=A0A0F9G1A9_9ZZZZ